jgi:ABC-type glycerol-3-phosphate transport system substrate-binding protein
MQIAKDREATRVWPTRRRVLAGGGVAGMALVAQACAGVNSTPAAGGATPGRSKEPVTIEVLTRSGVTSATGHSRWYADVTPKSFTPESNVTVNLVDAMPDVGAKLNILASSGTPPDVSWFGTLSDGFAGREQASKGIFKPLDDLIKRDKVDTAPYFKSMLDSMTVSGKLYALTTWFHYGVNTLYYNKEMTRAAGITVPDDGNWTIDEFITAAQKLTRRVDDVWGWWPDFVDVGERDLFWVRQFGGEFLDEAGKKVLLDSAESQAGLQWVYDAQAKFQTIDDLYRQGGFAALYRAGKLAFYCSTPGGVSEYRKPGQELIKFEPGFGVFPKHPKGMRGSQASGAGMGITNAPKQEAGWAWIKFITNKENGVAQVTGGAGSPGGRSDVWSDPRLLTFDPLFNNMLKAHPQGPAPLRQPANYRRTELLKVVGEQLEPFWRGRASVAEATSKAVQAGNAVLSQ